MQPATSEARSIPREPKSAPLTEPIKGFNGRYIVRQPADNNAEQLCEGFATAVIAGPANCGKTSMTLRLIEHERKKGAAIVRLDGRESVFRFMPDDTEAFATILRERLLNGVYAIIETTTPASQQLLDETFLRHVIGQTRLCFIVDSVELLPRTAQTFLFSLLRNWNGWRSNYQALEKTSIILAGNLPLSRWRMSGAIIELGNLTRTEVRELMYQYGCCDTFINQKLSDVMNKTMGDPLPTHVFICELINEAGTRYRIPE